MSFYRRDLPHLQRNGKAHFITFCMHHRVELPDWARDIVFDCCLHDHGRKAHIYAVAVMPDHVHMLFLPLPHPAGNKIFSLAEIMQPIKSASAHYINERLGRTGQVWQEESFDHVLRASETIEDKIDYILANPLRRRLAKTVFDYRWIWSEELHAAQAGRLGPRSGGFTVTSAAAAGSRSRP